MTQNQPDLTSPHASLEPDDLALGGPGPAAFPPEG